MISSVRPLYAGNALQVTLVPPVGALRWRLLRKGADNFTGHDDADALLVHEGTDTTLVDAAPGLINEVPAFYRAYYWNDAAWAASATAPGTPLATYADGSTDAHSLLRDRLEAGLAVEVARGKLKPTSHYIQVLTAPPSEEAVELPVVTVHLESERPSSRGIGEVIAADSFDELTGKWIESEGWLADVRIEIAAWSTNPDERIELRKALRRILVANLAVFDAAGMVEINIELRDADLINGEFAAPIYQALCNFSCQAPVIVTATADPITDVEVNVRAERPHVIN